MFALLVLFMLLVVAWDNNLQVIAQGVAVGYGDMPVSTTTQSISEQMRQHCNGSITEAQYQELLNLSDITTFQSYLEAPGRTRRIAEVFAEGGDRRGIFASMYVAITDESTRSAREGEYEHQTWAELLVYQFAIRYMGPLHDYLLGRDIEPRWQRYYDLVMECDNSGLYVLGTGVNTHLTYDLPWTLIEIGAEDAFEDDFMYFGELLVQKTEESTDLLYEQQGVDAYPFFNGFFVGEAVDAVAGDQTTARFIFQYVRSRAWTDYTLIRDNRPNSFMANNCERRWIARQQILRGMP